MNRLFSLLFIFTIYIAQSRSSYSKSNSIDDWHNTTDTIPVFSVMETTQTPVTAQYLLKTTQSGDTITTFKTTYLLSLVTPDSLFLPLNQTPEFPFPHPNALAFEDSIYPLKIVPVKTDEKITGITTFDVALLSRHILGIEPLTSPYKIIAADINKDGIINSLDLMALRRFILRVDTMFRRAPHWVFIPATYQMPPVVPSIDNIPQAYYFNPYSNLSIPFEFITVKVGDLNNSFSDTTVMGNLVEPRSHQPALVLATENQRLEKGQTYQLDFKCLKKEKFLALQGSFCLNTEGGAASAHLESQALTGFEEENNSAIDNNRIAFTWNEAVNKDFDAHTTLLTVKLTANTTGYLSEILKMNDDLSENLVYTEGGERRKLELQFLDAANDFYVSQNRPNPFTDETTIEIDVKTQNKEDIPAKWSVFDTKGSLIAQKSEVFQYGKHFLRLNAQALNLTQSGIYFLKVETATGTQSIKLIKMP